jgi:hypothetical protein
VSFEDFVDAPLIHSITRRYGVLKFAVPMAEPNCNGVVSS